MADYGSTNGGGQPDDPEGGGAGKPVQSFTIAEPSYNQINNGNNLTSPLNGRGGGGGGGSSALCCRGGGGGDNDGLKIIVISMFVFAAAVTVALIVDIASGEISLMVTKVQK